MDCPACGTSWQDHCMLLVLLLLLLLVAVVAGVVAVVAVVAAGVVARTTFE